MLAGYNKFDVSLFGIFRFLYKFKGSSCEEELVAMLTKEQQKELDLEDSRYAHDMMFYYNDVDKQTQKRR